MRERFILYAYEEPAKEVGLINCLYTLVWKELREKPVGKTNRFL